MNAKNPKVDGYVRKNKKWQQALEELRRVILTCPVKEEVKWRVPCYTFEGSNVVILGAFKEYCAMGFVKGVLLKDPHGVLKKPGENSQSMRVIRFTEVGQVVEIEPILKEYVREAIEVEKSGLKVKLKKITQRKVPEELQRKFNENPAFKTAFRALTPGRQRAYLIFFSSAKQSETRTSRVEKHLQRILSGKGMDD